MASPRKFRLKRRQIGGKVLDPVGLTQVATADLTDTANLANLQDLGLYSYRGWEPSFFDGYRGLLSDAISGGDGNWTLIGTVLGDSTIVGETSAEAAGKIASDIDHFWMPAIGTDGGQSDQSYQCIVYSYDGPQADYSPYYLSLGNNATASIQFSNKITGAADGNEDLFVMIAGSVNSSSAGGDKVEVYYKQGVGNWQLLIDLTSSNAYAHFATVQTASVTTGFKIEYSSSAEQASSTTGVNGWVILVSGSTGL